MYVCMYVCMYVSSWFRLVMVHTYLNNTPQLVCIYIVIHYTLYIYIYIYIYIYSLIQYNIIFLPHAVSIIIQQNIYPTEDYKERHHVKYHVFKTSFVLVLLECTIVQYYQQKRLSHYYSYNLVIPASVLNSILVCVKATVVAPYFLVLLDFQCVCLYLHLPTLQCLWIWEGQTQG